ncbi:unnamed protein product [Prunus armeniaca]
MKKTFAFVKLGLSWGTMKGDGWLVRQGMLDTLEVVVVLRGFGNISMELLHVNLKINIGRMFPSRGLYIRGVLSTKASFVWHNGLMGEGSRKASREIMKYGVFNKDGNV